jgi:hypothetical protein
MKKELGMLNCWETESVAIKKSKGRLVYKSTSILRHKQVNSSLGRV